MTHSTNPPTSASTRMLAITHCHGPDLRGEGPSTGQPALFVQMAGRDATHPARDTLLYRDGSRPEPMGYRRRFPVHELVEWAVGSSTRLLVVTGGEPLAQQAKLVALVADLDRFGQRVEIETNATLAPTPALIAATHLFVVAPRLSSYEDESTADERINPAVLEAFVSSERAVFSFVVAEPYDLDEISALEDRFSLYPIWVAPAGSTPEQVLTTMSWLADAILDRGWHLSGRLRMLLRSDYPPREQLPAAAGDLPTDATPHVAEWPTGWCHDT